MGRELSISVACYKLIAKIASGHPENFAHLTFNSIHRLTGSKLPQGDLIQIAQYLSGDRANLLNARFEYINDDENFVLSEENSYYAVNDDAIEHPTTGKVIEGVKDDVFMFFELNMNNVELLNSLYSTLSTSIVVKPLSSESNSLSLYLSMLEGVNAK
ncbi:hypothetical protein P4S70_01285 [Enterovibrio sp. Hal110]